MEQIKKFNVLRWDFNTDKLTYYDVLPYFIDRYKENLNFSKKHKDNLSEFWKVPKTLEDFKEFIERNSKYQFWGRCEYEMICHGWPVRENDYKLDVHEQIMMNIDIIAEILYNELIIK